MAKILVAWDNSPYVKCEPNYTKKWGRKLRQYMPKLVETFLSVCREAYPRQIKKTIDYKLST